MPQWDIVVAGHLCLDITPTFQPTRAKNFGELLVPGKLLNVGSCVVSTGGPVSNTGIALVKLGARTLVMAKVGDDPFGMSVVEKMREYDAAEGIIVVPDEHTSYTVALAPPGLDRVFLHHTGANDTFAADDVPYEKLDDVGIFHFGYPPLMRRMYLDDGAELESLLRRARERGVTVSLDLSLPDPESESGQANWERILERALPHVDIFVPSAEEVCFALERERFMALRRQAADTGVDTLDLLTPEDYSRLSARLLEYGPGVVTLKSGHRGMYLRTAGRERLASFGRTPVPDTASWADRELWEPPFTVERVASATGAGDSAIAGFLAGFIRGETVEGALRYAAAAGAQNVVVLDATSGIRGFEETRASLDSWGKAIIDIAGEGWSYDDDARLWRGPSDSGA